MRPERVKILALQLAGLPIQLSLVRDKMLHPQDHHQGRTVDVVSIGGNKCYGVFMHTWYGLGECTTICATQEQVKQRMGPDWQWNGRHGVNTVDQRSCDIRKIKLSGSLCQ